MIQEPKGLRCIAIGIVPEYPRVFWDMDCKDKKDGLESLHDYLKQYSHAFFLNQDPHYAIYETSNGYHLIIGCRDWDEAQTRLYDLKKMTHGQSIMSCRKQRIRVSPKWAANGIDEKGLSFVDQRELRTNFEVSPEPMLTETNTDFELRTGRKEIYFTYNTGLNAGNVLDELGIVH